MSHSKTDTVTLYNGDHITGEIVHLRSARLALNTDAMGTIHIEWKRVASIDSDFRYELRLMDGERSFGTVSPGDVPGVIVFEDEYNERSLSWMEIVELRPIEANIEDRLDLYLSANYAFTKASGVTQTELRANLDYENDDSLNSLSSRTTVSATDEDTTSSSRYSLTRRVWTDRQAMYRTVFGGYENNDEFALDYRITMGGGLGRYLADNNTSQLVGTLAIQGLQERSNNGEQEENVEAVLSLGYRRWRFDTPELDLLIDTYIYPSLSDRGRVRADSNARLRWELVKDLYWDVSFWGSYDSSAIDADAGQFDWGLTTGVGWDF